VIFFVRNSTFIHHRIVNYTTIVHTMKTTYFFLLLFVILGACKSKEQSVQGERKENTKKKILTGVTIQGVTIESFPKYAPSGEKWDAYAPFATDPDLFVRVKWNEQIIYKSETREDCPFGTPVPFSVGLPFKVKPFDQQLLIEVFDEDGISSNDNVGYFNLKLTEHKGKKQIKLQDAKGELVLLMDVEWIY
jgi:hypothetical protein